MSSGDVPVISVARVVRVGWLVVLAGALVGAGLGIVGWTLWPTQYQAQAVVEVGGPSSGTDDEINMETQAAIATSTNVLGEAAADTDTGWTALTLADALSVTVPRGAEVLELTVTAATAPAAADAANAVADAYLADRTEVNAGAQTQNIQALQDRIDATRERLRDATSDERRAALEARLDDLDQQRTDAQTAFGDVGRVLSEAQAPRSPSGLGVAAWGGAGLLSGALIGIYIATIIARSRRHR